MTAALRCPSVAELRHRLRWAARARGAGRRRRPGEDGHGQRSDLQREVDHVPRPMRYVASKERRHRPDLRPPSSRASLSAGLPARTTRARRPRGCRDKTFVHDIVTASSGATRTGALPGFDPRPAPSLDLYGRACELAREQLERSPGGGLESAAMRARGADAKLARTPATRPRAHSSSPPRSAAGAGLFDLLPRAGYGLDRGGEAKRHE